MTIRRYLIFTFAIGLWIPALAQTSLDAPLVDKPPTLRSEMLRGKDAAVTCLLKYTMQPEPLQHCFDSLHDANRQKQFTNFEAFDTGFYFIAWSEFNGTASISTPTLGINHKIVKSVEALYWDNYKKARKTVGVSDDVVIEALMLKGPTKDKTSAAAAEYGD